MEEFKDKVAIVTGAASGIGRGLAERCVQEGMSTVLADIEEEALIQAEEGMAAAGANVLAIRTDVSKASDVEALARGTLEAFGAVHLLFNNAGVGGPFSIWESTLAECEWMINTNLWGVINCVRVFVPIMLAQDSDCAIVNTASAASFMSYPAWGIYNVTKHGVLTLSETLYHDLAGRNAKVKIHVLCPGHVRTRIVDSERNRPKAQLDGLAEATMSPETVRNSRQWKEQGRRLIEQGMPPEQVADCTFNAIRKDQFYVLTHPWIKSMARMRVEDILLEQNPRRPPANPE